MNDKQLDQALENWKEWRAPKDVLFATDEKFLGDFFAKAAQLPSQNTPAMRFWAIANKIAACFVIVLGLLYGVHLLAAAFRDGMATMASAIIGSGQSYTSVASASAGNNCSSNASIAMSTHASITGDDDSPHMKSLDRLAKTQARRMTPNSASSEEAEDSWSANIPQLNTEEYKNVSEKPFLTVATNPLSTFGADVDTAGYGTLRRMVMQGNQLPPANAVRMEEMLNYFRYDYPMPENGEMLRPHFEMQAAPWNKDHQLLLVGIQAKTMPAADLPPSHYVFLIDNSGSMSHVFPMVKDAMTALARQLRKGDSVSMVTYGGGVNVLLEAAWDANVVCDAIAKLRVGGYTPGGEGIQTAYRLAEKHFIKNGNNRIVLITDGDFNVGTSSEAELVRMVEAKQKSCIYLTAVGCGMGNYKDNKMKMLANKGNGNYFYLDNAWEAKNIFVNGMTGNMYTICRDVKFQLEFNQSKVFAYRLLGYELRTMASTDFRNDAKDSGEVGMGQQVTVLYEIVPANASEEVKNQAAPGQQPLKYVVAENIANDELLTFRIRYKLPQGDAPAVEKTMALTNVAEPTGNWNWAASVAETALRLRRSQYAGDADYARAAKRAQASLGDDADGRRAEFLMLIRRVQELDTK